MKMAELAEANGTVIPDARAQETAHIDEIILRHPHKTGQAINILNDVQAEFRYLPLTALERVSEKTGTPFEILKEMGIFYKSLSLDPVGQYLLEVCDGTACHTCGAQSLIQAFEKKLGISVGQTTADGLVTLRAVHCIGACGIAPVVVSDETVYGHVKLSQIQKIAEELIDGGEHDA